MKPLFFLLSLVATTISAQTLDPPKIITEKKGNVTNSYAEGSLASTQAPGCISLTEAKNTLTPADLYQGVSDCMQQDKYERATGLFALAGIYGRFDAKRVADKSAGQAAIVLIMNTFANTPEDKKSKFQEQFTRITKTPELLAKLCSDIQKLGRPDYYPSYMILHGIGAFTGNPHEGALLKDFDAPKVWTELQKNYLHCPV